MKLTLHAAAVTASTADRTISGTIVRYGTPGRTSAGLLSVRAGALTWPTDLSRVKLTTEHDRAQVVGYMSHLDDDEAQASGTFKVARTPAGDVALLEASERVRDGLSFDLVDVEVDGSEIVSAIVVATGQVNFPAYDDSRVLTVAASQTSAPTTQGDPMPEPTTAATAAATDPAPVTADDTPPAATAAAAPEPAAQASAPAGVPVTGSAQVTDRDPLTTMVRHITASLSGRRTAEVVAALADITDTEHSDHIARESWIGQLWSGLVYQRQFVPLLNSGPLTARKGKGWRWVVKPEVSDYTGDKAEVPTNVPETEDADWTAARLAGAHDIDRSYYDFGDEDFIRSYLEAMRESYALKSDLKALAYMQAAAATPSGVTAQANILKAAAIASVYAKRATNGQAPSAFLVNDLDMLSLLEVTNENALKYLELFGIRPESFRSSDRVAAGNVTAVVKQAATFRELPGSPIRVSAQHIANGGVDEALFGYWAVEEHHPTAFVKVPYAPAPVDPEA